MANTPPAPEPAPEPEAPPGAAALDALRQLERFYLEDGRLDHNAESIDADPRTPAGEHAGDPRSHLKLPDGVQCYAIAATKARGASGKLSSDGLVPVDSALGRHAKPELTLGFPETHQWIAYAMGHLDLLSRAEVYETIRSGLSA